MWGMNFVKIGAIILIIIAGLAGSYFIIKNSAPLFFNEQISENKISGAVEKVREIKEEIKKEIAKNPIKWIEQSLKLEELSGDSENLKSGNSSKEEIILTESTLTKISTSTLLKKIFNSESDNAIDINSLVESQKIFSKSGFSQEEFEKIKKDKYGRPLSFEELMEKAVSGENQGELKDSFFAWKSLAERLLKDFKAGDVSSATVNKIVPWLEYYVQTANKLSNGNLSLIKIKTLSDQYQKKAESILPKLQVLGPMEKLFSLIKGFIKPVMAQSYVYDFGGLIGSYTDVCATGVAVAIIGIKGGILWIYYANWTLNPYANWMMFPDYYVLGRAMWGPGYCTYVGIDGGHAAGIAMILYFGSSALPL